jgi:hypothetical protein
MRTSITGIAIYRNEFDTEFISLDVTLKEFKKMIEDYRKDKSTKEAVSTSATKSRSSKAAAEASSSTATLKNASPPLRVLNSLGTTLDEFETQCSDVVKAMILNHKEYIKRTHKDFHIRLIASGGLLWNKDSKNRPRDYLIAAIATVLESHEVPRYRPQLLEKSPGAKILRKELSDYLFSIAKTNFVKTSPLQAPPDENAGVTQPGDAGEVPDYETLKEWTFADLLEVESGPFKKINIAYGAYQLKLTVSSENAKANEENIRTINTLAKSEFLQCSEHGVKKGTLETLAYDAINVLNNVG